MNELDIINNVSFLPEIIDESSADLSTKVRVPVSEIAAYGAAFQPLAQSIKGMFGGATTQVCNVTIPAGGHLASFHDGSGMLGTVLNNSTNTIMAQARINPLVCNPMLLCMSVALSGINRKLDEIQEAQKEILNYLVQKDKAELRGNVKFLYDLLEDYKYNTDNEKFIAANHVKVLDIRQSAQQKIIFYTDKIQTKLAKKSFLVLDKTVKSEINNLQAEFKDYQLSTYLFAFSSFLEVMLLKNYNANYLANVMSKIKINSESFCELHNKFVEKIEGQAKTSVENSLVKGLSSVSKFMGKTIEKVPVINKSQLDENLIKASDKLDLKHIENTAKVMNMIINEQEKYIKPFVDNIKLVDKIYNEGFDLTIDNEAVYLTADENK